MPCFLMNKSVRNTTGSAQRPARFTFGGFGGGGFNINLEDILGGTFSRRFWWLSAPFNPSWIRHPPSSHRFASRCLLGTEQEVVVDLPEPCGTCDGTGAKDGKLKTCSTCGGLGHVRVRQQVGPFIQEAVQTCQDCGGRGQIAEQPCPDCSGRGQKLKSSTLRFTVPEGAEDGTRMRMRGKGEPAPQGVGEPGDLFIELEIEEHVWFERSGSDLIMSLPLGYADLVLGTTVELEHLDGKPLIIKVPAHSNSGETIELRKRGLPRQRGGGRGDVVVLLNSTCPRKFPRPREKDWMLRTSVPTMLKPASSTMPNNAAVVDAKLNGEGFREYGQQTVGRSCAR